MSTLDRRSFLGSLIATAALAGSAPGRAQAASRRGRAPNILLLIADDLGDRDLGCYGHPTIRTDNIDKLACSGVRFTNAFVTTSSCSPSRTTMFTGKYPHATGAESLHVPLPEGTRILPDYLKEKKYWSANVGKLHLGPVGAAQFDLVLDSEWDWKQAMDKRPKDRPFFMAVGFHDPHRPYQPDTISDPAAASDTIVPPYLVDDTATRSELAGYYDEVTRMDREIGKIDSWLDENKLTDDTLVLFVSDNGMPFPRAKGSCYDSGVRVPMIVRWPGKASAGSVCDSLVSTVDLTPSMLSAAGIKADKGMQGRDATAMFANPATEIRDYVHVERNWHNHDDNQRGVRDRSFKYIHNGRPRVWTSSSDLMGSDSWTSLLAGRDRNELTAEQMRLFMVPRAAEELYDTERDPWEFVNLAGDPNYAGVLARLRDECADWRKATNDYPSERRYKDNLDRFTRTKYGKTSGAPEPYDGND
jgi:N-sulfoglucosamine sulfohydrolase